MKSELFILNTQAILLHTLKDDTACWSQLALQFLRVVVVECDIYLQTLSSGIEHIICQETGFNYDLTSTLHVPCVSTD